MTDLMPDIANDQRLDPRLKALLAAMPSGPSPSDVASRDEMLAEANQPDAIAQREMMTALFDSMDSEEIAPSTGLEVTRPRRDVGPRRQRHQGSPDPPDRHDARSRACTTSTAAACRR